MPDNDEDKGFFGPLIKNINDTIVFGFRVVWSNFLDFWPDVLKKGIDVFMQFMGSVEDGAWDNMIESYAHMGLFTHEQGDQLKFIKDLSSPLDLVAYVYMQLGLMKSLLDINAEAGGNFMRQSLSYKIRSSLPHYADVINAAFVAPEKTGEVRDVMRKQGLPEEMIDLLFLSSYRLYNEDVIRELYLREELTNDETIMRLRELGYTDTRIDELVKLWQVIPPIQDLITMVAHEAFEPDIVSKIGLDDEFPSEQSEWLRKQGLSEYWQHNYWRSHWDQPSLQMGFEMLHRGVIDLDTLDMLFRIVEIPPYWRDKLTAIAYQPYTRVDVRRMHELGVLDDQQLLTSYMDLGYDEEHAINMANFTLLYNQQNDKDISQSQILKSYTQGLIDRNDASELLIQLGYSESRADFILTYTEYQQELDYQDQLVENIKKRYQDNLIDGIVARDRLTKLNLPSRAIDIYMDTWEINRLSNEKKPSKTDLDKFLRNKVINVDEYRIEMDNLGYGAKYINWYQTLVEKGKAG